MRFLCVMTVNIQFNSAVTTGVIQNKMFCRSSKKHLGGNSGQCLGGGDLCQIVKGRKVGACVGSGGTLSPSYVLTVGDHVVLANFLLSLGLSVPIWKKKGQTR